jgi:hypothetical protein
MAKIGKYLIDLIVSCLVIFIIVPLTVVLFMLALTVSLLGLTTLIVVAFTCLIYDLRT